jgi:hypothetical protein
MADPAMPREITDKDGITWSCIQAFAGLGNDPEKADAARVNGSDRLHVVCTPSGGAASVRLELPDGWERECPTATFCKKSRSNSVLTRLNRKEAR